MVGRHVRVDCLHGDFSLSDKLFNLESSHEGISRTDAREQSCRSNP